MTSKRSFLKLVFDNLKRHAEILYFTILVFVIDVLATFINIQNIISNENLHQLTSSYYPLQAQQETIVNIKEQIAEVFEPNLLYGILAFAVGVIIAYDFFRNLHSKKETDFYESLPISRQKRFGVSSVSSILLFTVPLIVATGLNIVIVCASGFMTWEIFRFALWALLSNFLSFLLGFTTAVLAMILTGHIIVAVFGFGVICIYIPVLIAFLYPVYSATFFDNFIWDTYNSAYYFFSPATLLYKMVYNWKTWTILEHGKYMIGSAVFVVLIGVLSYFLFMKRPSETAGRAMAFEKKNFIIRLLLVIPISLYAGQLMYHIVNVGTAGKIVWMLFGIMFGSVLLHCIMESIFQFDIKAAFHAKKQLFVSVGVALLFLCVFAFDIFGYDKYIPNADGLKSIHISTYIGNSEGYRDTDGGGITGKQIPAAIDAIKDIYKWIESQDDTDDSQHRFYNNFEITYVYKNGMKTKRCYYFIGNEFPESFEKIFTTEEYKDDLCILYQKDRYDISSVEISNAVDNRSYTEYRYDLEELYSIYLSEYTDATLYQFLTEDMVYELRLNVNETNSYGQKYTSSYRYPVYKSFTETIKFIEESGLLSFANIEEMKLICLHVYSGKYANGNQMYIEDEEILNKLRPYLVSTQFVNDNVDNHIYCELRYEYQERENVISVYIPTEEFLKIYGQ